MLKNISNLGTALNKTKLQAINGGGYCCHSAFQVCDTEFPHSHTSFLACMDFLNCGGAQ